MENMLKTILLQTWFLPTALIVGGFFIGYIFDQILLRKLKGWRIATECKKKEENLLLRTIKRLGRFWFFLWGVYLSLPYIPLSEIARGKITTALEVLVLLSATLIIARNLVALVELYTEKYRNILPRTSIFSNLTRFTIFALGGLIILQSLGISVAPILAALGIGGLAIALALQPTLENLFSGLQIILSRQVKPGDYIKLDNGHSGTVHDINWRNTAILDSGNNMIIVPNSKLASAIMTNYNQPSTPTAVILNLGVAYSGDLKKVEAETLEVARLTMKEVEGGTAGFEPFLRYHTFNQSSIDFSITLRCDKFANHCLLKHELIKRLQEHYKKVGIEIPFPAHTIYMKKEV